jgi:Domain of unknown function (DUF4249)
LKKIFAFIFLVVFASCIDPYIPDLKNYKSLLVVEGLITNENNSYTIKLYSTTSKENSLPEKVADANVYITYGDGIKTDLQNCGDGYYKTDSTSFIGVIGQKYTLHIFTSDEKEYKSEECTMIPVAGIDKLYYEQGEEVIGTQGESFAGLKILLNPSDATGMNQYFRWTFEEVWKFRIPYPQHYTYTFINDTTFNFEPLPVIENVCWKKSQSGDIIINSILTAGASSINNQEIQFIASVKSDRLTEQYSILVKQYSISEKEYDFWKNLKKAGEAGGDIFASQPYRVISNIHNVKDGGEMVLGYFEVSAVSQKRMYITTHELDPLMLPYYKTDCQLFGKSPDDYANLKPTLTWDGIYHTFADQSMYVFIGPEVSAGIVAGHVLKKDLLKFYFSTKTCAICELTGFATKPDFWIDLE